MSRVSLSGVRDGRKDASRVLEIVSVFVRNLGIYAKSRCVVRVLLLFERSIYITIGVSCSPMENILKLNM